MSGIERVRGKSVVVVFEGGRCIHSRQCVLARPDVFVPNVEGEWIHPDNATPEEMVALAENCPSGAIAYERLDGGKGETAPMVNVARVRQNGPIAFHAELDIDGEPPRFRATLCRCGASKSKPYCDGSHVAIDFVATGEPMILDSQPLASRAGQLKVMPAKDGPLVVRGNLEIVSGTGHTVNRVTKTALCRCGRSRNKPYCDGTHAEIGFTSG
jgi:CDGSH-type Zn-finger protein/uncharacterized Fe-S cluster protein YjdI